MSLFISGLYCSNGVSLLLSLFDQEHAMFFHLSYKLYVIFKILQVVYCKLHIFPTQTGFLALRLRWLQRNIATIFSTRKRVYLAH